MPKILHGTWLAATYAFSPDLQKAIGPGFLRWTLQNGVNSSAHLLWLILK